MLKLTIKFKTIKIKVFISWLRKSGKKYIQLTLKARRNLRQIS